MSRQARHELVMLLIEKLGSEASVAATVGVTEMAVRKWKYQSTHPSNITLKKLLEQSLDLDTKRVIEILENDKKKFDLALKKISEFVMSSFGSIVLREFRA